MKLMLKLKPLQAQIGQNIMAGGGGTRKQEQSNMSQITVPRVTMLQTRLIHTASFNLLRGRPSGTLLGIALCSVLKSQLTAHTALITTKHRAGQRQEQPLYSLTHNHAIVAITQAGLLNVCVCMHPCLYCHCRGGHCNCEYSQMKMSLSTL